MREKIIRCHALLLALFVFAPAGCVSSPSSGQSMTKLTPEQKAVKASYDNVIAAYVEGDLAKAFGLMSRWSRVHFNVKTLEEFERAYRSDEINILHDARNSQVRMIGVNGNAATIMVLNPQGMEVLHEMVLESGQWKLNW